MKQLLERLAELAPRECIFNSTNQGWFFPILDKRGGQAIVHPEQPHFEAVIFYAVLMCCEARGWMFMRDWDLSPRYGPYWCIRDEALTFRKIEWEEDFSSTSAAALTAYIKALEASQ